MFITVNPFAFFILAGLKTIESASPQPGIFLFISTSILAASTVISSVKGIKALHDLMNVL